MKSKFGSAIGATIFACLLISFPAMAEDGITEREKRDCRGDYHKYCSEYGLGTEALRACMSRSIKKISNMCVAALVDAGEMTQAQANKLRAKAKTTTKKPTHKKVTSKSSKKKH
jgi:hypothetical protein